jgi:hypothetical protein
MISGLVMKYLNVLGLVIVRAYRPTVCPSSKFALTTPQYPLAPAWHQKAPSPHWKSNSRVKFIVCWYTDPAHSHWEVEKGRFRPEGEDQQCLPG